MRGSQICRCFCGKVLHGEHEADVSKHDENTDVELNSGHALIDTRDDFLRDSMR